MCVTLKWASAFGFQIKVKRTFICIDAEYVNKNLGLICLCYL